MLINSEIIFSLATGVLYFQPLARSTNSGCSGIQSNSDIQQLIIETVRRRCERLRYGFPEKCRRTISNDRWTGLLLLLILLLLFLPRLTPCARSRCYTLGYPRAHFHQTRPRRPHTHAGPDAHTHTRRLISCHCSTGEHVIVARSLLLFAWERRSRTPLERDLLLLGKRNTTWLHRHPPLAIHFSIPLIRFIPFFLWLFYSRSPACSYALLMLRCVHSESLLRRRYSSNFDRTTYHLLVLFLKIECCGMLFSFASTEVILITPSSIIAWRNFLLNLCFSPTCSGFEKKNYLICNGTHVAEE